MNWASKPRHQMIFLNRMETNKQTKKKKSLNVYVKCSEDYIETIVLMEPRQNSNVQIARGDAAAAAGADASTNPYFGSLFSAMELEGPPGRPAAQLVEGGGGWGELNYCGSLVNRCFPTVSVLLCARAHEQSRVFPLGSLILVFS